MLNERVCANGTVFPVVQSRAHETLEEGVNAHAELYRHVADLSQDEATYFHLMVQLTVTDKQYLAEILKPAFCSWKDGFSAVKILPDLALINWMDRAKLDKDEKRCWRSALRRSMLLGNQTAYDCIEEALRARMEHSAGVTLLSS